MKQKPCTLLKLSFTLVLLHTFLFVFPSQNEPVTPANALKTYLQNGDNSFRWEIHESLKKANSTLYRLLFTSQIWQNIEWRHELTVITPDNLKHHDALLFISGGSLKDGIPNLHKWDDGTIKSMEQIAMANQTVVAILWQVPNQPLYDGRTEDELISHTLHNFQKDRDFNWPLLFPMTKSAIRAMDAIQEFTVKEVRSKVKGFVVSGASKRGWTTWLTGASDPRVKAIGPMVIDMLNMPDNINYHKVAWGDYSIQIEDYVKLGIAQQVNTPEGSDLVQMIDPYSYRKSLTMPKMIFIGTNDEYWPVDAIKHYIDSIPGENYICYTPNAGHDLGDKKVALATLGGFLGNTIKKGDYPEFDYSVTENNGKINLTIQSHDRKMEDAIFWSADSDDRDFRDEEWTGKSLGKSGKTTFELEISFPENGYKAFYIDLTYKAAFGGEFTQSTRMFLMNNKELLLKDK